MARTTVGVYTGVAGFVVLALAASVQATNFAVFGDWGRAGGSGAGAFPYANYDPKMTAPCPPSVADPNYLDIQTGDGFPNSPKEASCIVGYCAGFEDGSDQRENCVGKVEQLEVAWFFNKVCAKKQCKFIINTSDNFYINGCSGPSDCASRFESDWKAVYGNPAVTPALANLVWYGGFGNHDILGNISGIEAQIAYTQKDPHWYVPSRWFNVTVGSGKTAINIVSIHTSPLLDSYLKAGSAYAATDEQLVFGTTFARDQQLLFFEEALAHANTLPGWTVVNAHHPCFGGSTSYCKVDGTNSAESAAWEQVNALVKKYKPVAYFNGHDHVLTHSTVPGYATQFIVSGAGSFTEPGDGGWNSTDNAFDAGKPYLKYSNVVMKDGKSFTGLATVDVSATTFKIEFYSTPTGTTPQYTVTCKYTGTGKEFTCTNTPGKNAAFSQK